MPGSVSGSKPEYRCSTRLVSRGSPEPSWKAIRSGPEPCQGPVAPSRRVEVPDEVLGDGTCVVDRLMQHRRPREVCDLAVVLGGHRWEGLTGWRVELEVPVER